MDKNLSKADLVSLLAGSRYCGDDWACIQDCMGVDFVAMAKLDGLYTDGCGEGLRGDLHVCLCCTVTALESGILSTPATPVWCEADYRWVVVSSQREARAVEPYLSATCGVLYSRSLGNLGFSIGKPAMVQRVGPSKVRSELLIELFSDLAMCKAHISARRSA